MATRSPCSTPATLPAQHIGQPTGLRMQLGVAVRTHLRAFAIGNDRDVVGCAQILGPAHAAQPAMFMRGGTCQPKRCCMAVWWSFRESEEPGASAVKEAIFGRRGDRSMHGGIRRAGGLKRRQAVSGIQHRRQSRQLPHRCHVSACHASPHTPTGTTRTLSRVGLCPPRQRPSLHKMRPCTPLPPPNLHRNLPATQHHRARAWWLPSTTSCNGRARCMR